MKNQLLRLVLADDQVLFVKSLKYVLEGLASDVKIVDVVTDGKQAIDSCEKHQPDLILLDVRMPGMDGVQASKIIHQRRPRIKIIMLTTFPDDEYVHQAIKNGAVGYLLKNIPPEDLILNIRAASRGTYLMDPDMARKAMGEEPEKSYHQALIEELSPREKEVFSLIMKMYNNRNIAEELHLTEQSVRNYIHNLYAKFEIFDRMHFIRSLKMHS